MKQVIAVLLLLALLLAFVVWNAVYINNVATRFSRLVENLPSVDDPDCASAAASLRAEWKRCLPLVDLSVSYTLSDRGGEQTALLAACAASGDAFGYASARALLSDALDDLRHAERFSPVSLF